MKRKITTILIAISVSTAPLLATLLVWHLIFMHLHNRTLADPAAIIGVFVGPALFPFVLAGTVATCCRSIPVRRRPLAITLGFVGTGLTGFTILFWWGMYHWGSIG